MAEALSPVLSADQESRISWLLQRVCNAELRLVTAESCTGGLVASLLTDVPGCSHAFEAGFVTYSDIAKISLLGIAPELIEKFSAVSKPVALAMVDGALQRSRGDLAISVTGYTDQIASGSEAGLVYIGGGNRDGKRICLENHFGNVGRARSRMLSMDAALDVLEMILPHGHKYPDCVT
jgi:nicotinamide-nucleotide amidase